MRVLGIIPARSGSKGIPRKNLVEVLGRPLLAYTAEVALAASSLTRVVLSTDDAEIAAVGRQLGLEVPFLRPAALALDSTPTIPVIQHAVERLKTEGDQYDAVFTLQVTNPMRTVADIDGAIQLLSTTGADSVVGYTDVGERHPARMKLIDDAGRVVDPPFAEEYEGQRRQELPPMYLRDGSVYVTRMATLMQGSIKGLDCRAWIIPRERACNIDEAFDLYLFEKLLELRNRQSP